MNIGLIGYGTVGRGVENILSNQFSGILKAVADIHFDEKSRESLESSDIEVTDDWKKVVYRKDIDIVVEVTGRQDEAVEIIEESLFQDKSVVTANKALLATERGFDLLCLAGGRHLSLRYEAAVGGGIPIINTLKTDYRGDPIFRIRAILNGTSNFILDEMTNRHLSYESALKKAQKLGYAEADPGADVDGFDSACKIALLGRIAHRWGWNSYDAKTTGITKITPEAIAKAEKKNQVYKLIAEATKWELTVKPELVSKDSVFGQVHGPNNLIEIESQYRGIVHLFGPGAGSDAAGAAVVGDIIEIARKLDPSESWDRWR